MVIWGQVNNYQQYWDHRNNLYKTSLSKTCILDEEHRPQNHSQKVMLKLVVKHCKQYYLLQWQCYIRSQSLWDTILKGTLVGISFFQVTLGTIELREIVQWTWLRTLKIPKNGQCEEFCISRRYHKLSQDWGKQQLGVLVVQRNWKFGWTETPDGQLWNDVCHIEYSPWSLGSLVSTVIYSWPFIQAAYKQLVREIGR